MVDPNDQDVIHDLNDEDAQISLARGTHGWSTKEAITMNRTLRRIQNRTDSTTFLKQSDGESLEFVLNDRLSGTDVSSLGRNNQEGRITIAVSAFHSAGTVFSAVVYQISKNWDNEAASSWKKSFRKISKWVVAENADSAKLTEYHVRALGNFWYDVRAKFTSVRAATTPLEDFARSFTQFFVSRAEGERVAPAKMEYIGRILGGSL